MCHFEAIFELVAGSLLTNIFLNPWKLPSCRRLLAVLQHLIPYAVDSDICSSVSGGGAMWFPARDISAESLIIGALEAAFWEMDQQGRHSVHVLHFRVSNDLVLGRRISLMIAENKITINQLGSYDLKSGVTGLSTMKTYKEVTVADEHIQLF